MRIMVWTGAVVLSMLMAACVEDGSSSSSDANKWETLPVGDHLAIYGGSGPEDEVLSHVYEDDATIIFGGRGIRNESDETVTVEDARPVNRDTTLDIIGFVVQVWSENEGGVFAACGEFPPPYLTTHPIKGFALDPDVPVDIVVGVRSPERKPGEIRGIEIAYRGTDGQRYRQAFPFNGVVSSERPQEHCVPPEAYR